VTILLARWSLSLLLFAKTRRHQASSLTTQLAKLVDIIKGVKAPFFLLRFLR